MTTAFSPLSVTKPGEARNERPLSRRLIGRVLLTLVGGAVAIYAGATGTEKPSPDRRAGLAALLEKEGLYATPEDVHFFSLPETVLGAWVSSAHAVVVARKKDEPSDVYLVDAQVTSAGTLLGMGTAHNLSDTIGAEESNITLRGARVAYLSKSLVTGAKSTVTVVDFSGTADTAADMAGWPLAERLQQRVTNWQETGRASGMKTRKLALDTEGEVAIAFEGDLLRLDAASRHATFDFATGELAEGKGFATVESSELARPGNVVTWAVDRVRFEVGSDSMQAIKQYAFLGKEYIDRFREGVTNDTGAEGIAEDLGETALDAPKHVVVTDPELGWPPAKLETWVEPALPGEGEWNAKDDPAFYKQHPGLPPTFLTTFIRSDRSRKATRVYIAVWDPRQVELHMMAGTVEPKAATGNAGPGTIPRTPDVMKRVAAASNAGFQALHGEYGMMADGVVYLPPKPYAATVAVLSDGTTAFGTWPESPAIPPNVLSYRQNMTVMVQDEKFNPFNRTWWGGTVPGAEDKIHTVRTGICLTREKFVAYFYGADIGPDALSQAMIQTRCQYGIALDMNAGHSGMEFYNVAKEAELPALGRPITKYEGEGDVPDMPGYRFRAKALINGMGLMNFPRYIKREARDYFYMTLRHILPGPSLPRQVEGAADDEGTFQVKGLPQHGFPYAIATTRVRPDKANESGWFRVLAIDPRVVTPQGSAAASAAPAGGAADAKDPVFEIAAPEDKTGAGIFFSGRAFTVGKAEGADQLRLASGQAELASGAALACVHGESGFLFYAETESAGAVDLKAIDALLKAHGCVETVFFQKPLGLLLGDGTVLGGARPATVPSAKRIAFVRQPAPDGRRFFEDTPVVPRDVWYPLQQQRVRYFKKRDD